jgi:hypothetical protein
MNKRILFVLALATMAVFGCDKKADETKLSDDDVAVPGDFVEEAESSITPANYKGELDKLADEIDKE